MRLGALIAAALLSACGGTSEALAPRDAAVETGDSGDASADALPDAAPEAGPVVCVLAGAGFECSADGGAYETNPGGIWTSCASAPCQPGLECRAGNVSGVCTQR